MIEFWTDKDTDEVLICTDCLNLQIERTKKGIYIGDEIVTEDMYYRVGNHGQCDLCLEQCEDYPDCEGG